MNKWERYYRGIKTIRVKGVNKRSEWLVDSKEKFTAENYKNDSCIEIKKAQWRSNLHVTLGN